MFEYGIAQLNDLLFDELVDNVAKEALKPSIFVVQKAAAPKNGVEFRQGCNDTIRSSLWEPSLKKKEKNWEKYQPSGVGGTRSPPATPYRLQHLTAC